jgi:hypothetical protein
MLKRYLLDRFYLLFLVLALLILSGWILGDRELTLHILSVDGVRKVFDELPGIYEIMEFYKSKASRFYINKIRIRKWNY